MAERALVMAARDGFLGSVGPSGCHGRALAIVRSNTAAHARVCDPLTVTWQAANRTSAGVNLGSLLALVFESTGAYSEHTAKSWQMVQPDGTHSQAAEPVFASQSGVGSHLHC